MKKDNNPNFKEIDFKLPCSNDMWRRFQNYKENMFKDKAYTPSLYWKQREESFNIRYDKGFVYLDGLYNRNISKENKVGNFLRK